MSGFDCALCGRALEVTVLYKHVESEARWLIDHNVVPVERSPKPTVVETGELTIDLVKRLVSRDGESVSMSPKEWGVLETLAGHAGEWVANEHILSAVWGTAGHDHYLRMYVGYVRAKLGARYIENQWGGGYRLVLLPAPALVGALREPLNESARSRPADAGDQK